MYDYEFYFSDKLDIYFHYQWYLLCFSNKSSKNALKMNSEW